MEKRLVILHIANIGKDLCSGVNAVVPQHIRAQSAYAEVALLNVNGIDIGQVERQLPFESPFALSALPKPFDRPDLVIFQEAYCTRYLRIAAQLFRQGIPYIILPHGELGALSQTRKALKKKTANLLLFKRFFRRALAIQCLSEGEKNETHFGQRRIVATNGMSIPAKQKTGFRSEGLSLLYIGRLEAMHKGLDLMVEAVRQKAELLRNEHAVLNIYGPDYAGRAAHLQELIDTAGVGDIVKQHGPVFGAEKEALLLDCDMFIQTSRLEGMPLGILEALAYAVPCLVTRGTRLGEAVEERDCGWTAETDAASIAAQLERAVSEREQWAEKGLRGRGFVEQCFSWEHVTEETLEQYRALLGI